MKLTKRKIKKLLYRNMAEILDLDLHAGKIGDWVGNHHTPEELIRAGKHARKFVKKLRAKAELL